MAGAAVLYYATLFGSLYLGYRIGIGVAAKSRSSALGWVTGFAAWIAIGLAAQLALEAAIPDYGRHVGRITSQE